MNNHEQLLILKHITLGVLMQMEKKTKQLKPKCNSDSVFWGFWSKPKSNSIFLMNTEKVILHSWQVTASYIMEICAYSSSGVRTRAIKIKWWMVRDVFQYLLQTCLHFACRSFSLQSAGKAAEPNALNYNHQLQVTQVGSTVQYWLKNSPHEKAIPPSSYKTALLEEC